MAQCDENYWKDRYQSTGDRSTQREAVLAEYLERKTGRQVEPCGLGAESTAYIAGSVSKNGFEKGDADLHVVGTNVYIEVTGPLEGNVGPQQPLWFRPDKLENAVNNLANGHDTFLAHNCPRQSCGGWFTWTRRSPGATVQRRSRCGKSAFGERWNIMWRSMQQTPVCVPSGS